MSRPDIIVFDLDGTLVDTAPDLGGALAHTLRGLGLPAPPLETMRQWISGGGRKIVAGGIEAAGGTVTDDELDEAVTVFLAHYSTHLTDHSSPYPGVRETLQSLQAAGAHMGICTNKTFRYSVQLLAALELDGFFNGIVFGGDSLDVRKPDGRHVLAVIDKLGGSPERAVMVGDSATDVDAARNADIPVIVASFGYSDVPVVDLAADAVIDSFAELIPALAAL